MALTPEMLSAYEDHVLAEIEEHRTRYENTGNPVYVWEAIGLCFTLGAQRVRTQTGLLPDPLPGAEPYPLPPWCLLYLGTVSFRVASLLEGKDFRRAPKPFGNVEPSREAWQASVDAQPVLSPTEAVKLTPQALGLVKPGWNAFERHKKLNEMEMDDFVEGALRGEGKSAGEAMSILMEESGVDDERTMRRRLATVRKASRTKPTP